MLSTVYYNFITLFCDKCKLVKHKKPTYTNTIIDLNIKLMLNECSKRGLLI